jgi:DNA-binding Lrp family transcriptional regulator
MITDKDQALISLLKADARMSVSDLAKNLKVSRTTVKHRLSRLEDNGIITGYGVRLGDGYRNNTLQAYVNVEVHPKQAASVVGQLKKIPEIEALFTVSGKFDMVLLVRTMRPVQLDEVLDKIGELEGVSSTESAILLNTKFDRR